MAPEIEHENTPEKAFDAASSAAPAKKRNRKPLVWILGCVLVVVAVLLWLLFGGNVTKQVNVEAGSPSVNPNDHLHIRWLGSASFASDLSSLNVSKPGDYPVQIRFCGRVYDSMIRVVDTVAPTAVTQDVTTISVHVPDPEDYIAQVNDATQVHAEYAAQPDMNVAGVQTVSLQLTDEGGNVTSVEATLNVIIDTQAPVMEGAVDLETYRGQEPGYLDNITVTDDLDAAPVLTVDDSGVNLQNGGTYPVVYTCTDISGNSCSKTVSLTVIVDESAPTIFGVQPISLYAGSTVSYRSGIKLQDDTDANPKLTIDSSGVDLSTPGVYMVTYIATDGAGNESRIATNVTVAEKSSSYVEEDVIFEKVDSILASIITEDMTNAQKVNAVYNYIKRNYSYTSTADKTDVYQAAYRTMVRRSGNCFSFYAISKLMFDRLGLPNLSATRIKNPYRPFNHYWNMVSLDGGETYYYFDTCPRSPSKVNRYLMTDADLDYYDNHIIRGYYTRDLELYPTTPEELPEL